jgi:hypothetical protein
MLGSARFYFVLCKALRSQMVSCLQCKGRLLCGLAKCPILEKSRVASGFRLGRDVAGDSPPNMFVGWHGYPRVFAGPLISISPATVDNPAQLYGMDFDGIIASREGLVRGTKTASVRDPFSLGELRDAAMSVKTVGMEAHFAREPSLHVNFSDVMQPVGPSGEMDSLRLTTNPCVPSKVDELAEEKVKARAAVSELLAGGFEYYYLQKLLSAGILGAEKKLVPTRWAITATDRMVGDEHLAKVKECPAVSDYLVYSNEYLYNHYEILLLPGPWEFEQFEAWWQGSLWSPDESAVAHEYEPYGGRSDYADEEGGGYYAGRLAVAEGLARLGKQARAIVFREIYEGYRLPVGVWQVRESVRKAFEKPARSFQSLNEALADVSTRLKRPFAQYLARSVVLKQRKLYDY